MKYGYVERVDVVDSSSDVLVSVDFCISRSVLFEFMDALRPINQDAKREPIQAILDYSAELGVVGE